MMVASDLIGAMDLEIGHQYILLPFMAARETCPIISESAMINTQCNSEINIFNFVVIKVPADGLVPSGGRPSAGIVMTTVVFCGVVSL